MISTKIEIRINRERGSNKESGRERNEINREKSSEREINRE